MPIQKTDAIVLRTAKLRETSLIVTYLTRDFGKIKTVCKGIRIERGTLIGDFELFTHQEIVFYEKDNSELYFLSEWEPLNFFPNIRKDFDNLMWASYLVELVDAFTPLREPNKEIFDLLSDSLLYFSRVSADKLSRIFTVKFLCLSGFSLGLKDCLICRGKDAAKFFFNPHLGGLICNKCAGKTQDSSEITEGTLQALRSIAESNLGRSTKMKFDSLTEEEIAKLLKRFIDYRLSRELKSETFLREVSKS